MGSIKNFILKTPWLTADLLTYSRLFIFSPLVIYFSVIENYQAALIFFIIGFLTDLMDGYTARLKKHVKESGIILDAGTDKIFFLIPFMILGMRFLSQKMVTIIVSLEIFHITLIIFGQILGFPLKITGGLVHFLKMCLTGTMVGFLLIRFHPNVLSTVFLHLIIIASILNIFIYFFRVFKKAAIYTTKNDLG